MTSQEKVRELIEKLAEWTAENNVGGGLITGLLLGMSEEFEQSFPTDPATLDLYLLEVAALLLSGRSDDAEPAVICGPVYDVAELGMRGLDTTTGVVGWVPVPLADQAIEGTAEEQ